MNGRPLALRVEADLAIEVDGKSATLSGNGNTLVLTSAYPEAVWAAAVGAALPAGVGGASGPRAIGLVADQLAAAGLTLEVTGPRGRVVRLGDGVHSTLGQIATGSSAVAAGRPGAVAVVLWRGHRRLVASAGLGALAVAFWVRAIRR